MLNFYNGNKLDLIHKEFLKKENTLKQYLINRKFILKYKLTTYNIAELLLNNLLKTVNDKNHSIFLIL